MTGGSRLALAIAALAAVGMVTSLPLAGGAQREPTTHRVVVERFRFVPARIEIAPGDSVEWINRDIAPHTATADDGRWGSEALTKGEAAAIRFAAAGTFGYRCAFHSDMRGTVVVADE